MSVDDLRRNEIHHIEGVVALLEILPRDEFFVTASFIRQPAYWRTRVIEISVMTSEVDIEARARKLLNRLSALS